MAGGSLWKFAAGPINYSCATGLRKMLFCLSRNGDDSSLAFLHCAHNWSCDTLRDSVESIFKELSWTDLCVISTYSLMQI